MAFLKNLFIVVLILNVMKGSSQEDQTFFLNEITVSLNYTLMSGGENQGKPGFGVAGYHQFSQDKTLNLVLGLEYNLTRFFINSLYGGHYYSLHDLDYTTHSISFPVGFRIYLDSLNRFFLEPGLYADLMIAGKVKGYQTTYLQHGIVKSKTVEMEEQANLNSTGGLFMAIGMLVQLWGMDIILKPEIKVGMPIFEHQETLYNNYIRLGIGLKF